MYARESDGSSSANAGLGLSLLVALDVILGGSVRGSFISTASLEVIGCIVLMWCVLDDRLNPLSASAWWMVGITGLGVLICILQIVPLPQVWWSSLPGRATVSAGFTIAGLAHTDQPISLEPERTLYGVLRLLPPVAVFVLSAKLPSVSLNAPFRWTIMLLAVFSGVLALAQTFAKDIAYFFPQDNRGQAAGLFQVVNHQATLQLMAMPFIAALIAKLKVEFDLGDARQAQGIVCIAALMLVFVAVILSGSVAGYAMTVPVMAASCVLVFGAKPSPYLLVAGMLVGMGLAVLGYVAFTSPMLQGLGTTDLGEGPLSRREMLRTSFDMARDYWPVGTGLGAFESAYGSYENPATVTGAFITHAHNDYLEVAAELGLAGCVVALSVLAWWVVTTFRVWRRAPEETGRLKPAASVAVGVVLVHSLVDFPARTEAISCLAALCMGYMSAGSGSRHRQRIVEPHQAFKHRHVEI